MRSDIIIIIYNSADADSSRSKEGGKMHKFDFDDVVVWGIWVMLATASRRAKQASTVFVGRVYFSRCSLHELGRFLSNSGAFRLGVFCLYVGSDNAIYGSTHLNAFYT